MKKLLLAIIAIASANICAQAEDNHLYIVPNAGETLDWSVPTVQNMTFVNGNVVLNMKDGTSTYTPISSIKRMYICTPSANSISTVKGETEYTWDGETLHVNAQPGTQVNVYSVDGAAIINSQLTGSSVNLQGLRKGIYIVNVGGQAFKIVKK